jgi:hypothetical protein
MELSHTRVLGWLAMADGMGYVHQAAISYPLEKQFRFGI